MKLKNNRLLKKDFLEILNKDIKKIDITYKNIIGINKDIKIIDNENNIYFIEMTYKEFKKYENKINDIIKQL